MSTFGAAPPPTPTTRSQQRPALAKTIIQAESVYRIVLSAGLLACAAPRRSRFLSSSPRISATPAVHPRDHLGNTAAMTRGVVAAGHPLTAEAGASALRAGGNAVDAALAAMCASFVCEPLLTGLGAGGYMLVGAPGGADMLLDFFVAAPGRGDRAPRRSARAGFDCLR